tara:strand:+ start:1424 stop:2413 length:990 start_codon:yes stop_codon:yes gene_type:complete
MYKLIIIGSTSNICKIRVFKNISELDIFDKVYCYGWEQWSNSDFKSYLLNEVNGDTSNLINNIEFINGDYNDYNIKISYLIDDNTIIYVSTPPLCYDKILSFCKEIDYNFKIIFEKPFSSSYNDFIKLKEKITNKVNILDHFLYKLDIMDVIQELKNKEIKYIKLKFNYSDNVEDRLGYFDKVGFFKDMFQSHYLSIVYSLIGNKITNLKNSVIKKNIRKQYKSYGGKNKVDTYFYVELFDKRCTYIFEAGKSINDCKEITINNNTFKINNYENEYTLYFKSIIENTNLNFINQQELFWEIYDIIKNDFEANYKLQYYNYVTLTTDNKK